jgi:hypothetical protein
LIVHEKLRPAILVAKNFPDPKNFWEKPCTGDNERSPSVTPRNERHF